MCMHVNFLCHEKRATFKTHFCAQAILHVCVHVKADSLYSVGVLMTLHNH